MTNEERDTLHNRISQLTRSVNRLLDDAVALENEHGDVISKVRCDRSSAANLVHYLAVRRHDIRELQYELHVHGLSSLGRMEAYVVPTLLAVQAVLDRIAGKLGRQHRWGELRQAFDHNRSLLGRNTDALFGPPREDRKVRIMATMLSECADRYESVRELVAAGMDVMRINCAKDSPERWGRMIDHLRRAERELGRSCKIQMDLAGPNPRTGPLVRGANVVRWRPRFDAFGRPSRPASIYITRTGIRPKAADAALPVDDDALRQLRGGDVLRVVDTRGGVQDLLVTESESGGHWAEATEEAFVEPGAALEIVRNDETVYRGAVGSLPRQAKECTYRIGVGDLLVMTSSEIPGHPPRRNEDGEVIEPASVGCTLPEIFREVKAGERFYYDDGEMGAVIREVREEEILLEVTDARGGSAKIKSEKGVNFPSADCTHLPSLTAKDIDDLAFAAEHADIVGQSFVRGVADVESLIEELGRLGASSTGIVLKIETKRAFEGLPELLLAGMRHPPLGIMVARGDMGVELGFGRMSEVQEEILWLCEAAHVPVIWATQVLESLAKKGLPTRAEVTDAAMSGRAECVMLNKGEHLVETLEFLSDILRRMEGHQQKKLSTMRKLSISAMREKT